MNQQTLSSLIWSVADLLRGDFKQSEYGRVILPFTVLRRLDCVLEPTKAAVLKEHAAKQAAGIAFEPFVKRKAGLDFFNVSPLDMGKLMGDQDNIRANLDSYIQGFSPDVRSIFEHFDFAGSVERLHKAKLLYLVTEKFARIDLHPSAVDNVQMGLVFEELIRKFAEISNETAGEHFTPREVIRLMVNLLFIEDNDALTLPGVVRAMYDPTAGTGGMLSVAAEYLHELNPKARLTVFGQELNAESYAICKADMLIRGQDISNIVLGNTLSDDGLLGKLFDYMLSNPPFGVEWKKIEKAIRDEYEKQGHSGRFGPGLPRVSDGSLLFLLHLLSKMRPAAQGGSRIGIVLNGSPLFTGGAGSGESEIRRYVLENDLVEAIVALPTDMFYNTGISTYIWVLSNRNPAKAGFATDYLWEEVWQPDSWLEILGRYLVPVKNAKKQLSGWIFPRYHQLIATRKLLDSVRRDGPGGKYLIQHSAGSGKTNSIAWAAHFLADLHDDHNAKVFDTVIVISDRTVLDSQLRDAIMSFERTQGVVAVVTGEGASKSKELAEALAAGKKIVVCTLQTFPFALEEVRKLAASKGKRFAVIADEAHSSQTNETAAKLKLVLSAAELAELADGGEISTEDILAAQMAAKAGGDSKSGITYVAFTATPKDKTLQLFGTRPDPTRPPAADNIPAAFHVYSMRQAIEEGFILDVLRNYIPYKVAFSLAHKGKQIDSKEVDRSEAMKGIMGWVRLHEYNIAQRVQIVVEHFRRHVAGLLQGRAKAMVVTGSRKEAVRWQKAIQKYITNHGYKIDTLVAFSGEVIDPETGPDPFTEHSKDLNPRLNGQDIRSAFKGGDYSILLVANKFQTGFDEPLLVAMYVDKRLAGIQAVQTLSRLNRCYPGKDRTFVVDFVNDPDEILASFKPYFETAELAGVTDPYVVNELRSKLDGQCLYDTFEVDRVVAVAMKGAKAKQSELDAALTPVAERLLISFQKAKQALAAAGGDEKAASKAKDEMDALVLFRADLGTYVRLYGFLSQIFDYGNTDIEKRSIFFRLLLPLLTFGREREGIDLSALKLTAYTIKEMGDPKINLGAGDAVRIEPTQEGGSGQVQDKQKILLEELISRVNDLFEGELTPGDKLVYVNDVIKGKLMESEKLQEQAVNNTKEQFDNSPDLDKELEGAIMDALEAHSTMSKQALESAVLRADLKAVLLGAGKLWEGLRAKGLGSTGTGPLA